ncbi:MAG: hypothetical protein GWN71_10875, partial [Gammaproteobacteria bacterium]|nr:hypothetical protein [Gemmatimonadota bacterium]NIU74061.1 hypothetical protein [Gammaproteobacteria bacterium]
AVALKSAVLRQTLNVVVEDLPIEMAEGRAQGGGPPPRVDARRIRRIERTLFRCADRIVAPPGFARLIRERYDVDESRFRLFHRNIYPAEVPEEP